MSRGNWGPEVSLGNAGRIHIGGSCTIFARLRVNRKLQPLGSIFLVLLTDIEFILRKRWWWWWWWNILFPFFLVKIMDCYNLTLAHE